ncbi:O-succinylhomoserine sulfhydrylase [Lutibaculum baratangense]|uniref:O-succinylhomoserine sulfhydrylase n=1 Tax=Lutibaculum baratangense AMV1 TaxID=631454 RepID=V4RR27_9HYPH|nr:O-succinylhomoserine sulfhydrylase [Lutibaculum baratangense]ESR25605.1 O-acetylhomoserine sulfhydrylase [Lutibaculum baratangense AMV1]
MNDAPHSDDGFALATDLVHGGTLRSQFGETSEALFLNSGFVYDTAEAAEARFKGEAPGYVYSRYANPTVSMLEERMCRIEGAEAARATASGMAAVHAALMCQLRAGDHLVASRALFGSCLYIVEDLLPRFGVATTIVDGSDLEAWRDAVRPETKVFFLETPTNPTLEVLDLKSICDIAREAGARVTVDNVFATPLGQRPLELGASVVVYSATKHIDGQGRCLGGIILGSEEFVTTELKDFYRHTGPSMSPFNAWVLLKGLETLPLRVERQVSTAARLAERLAGQPGVRRLVYPGRPDHPQHELAKRQMRNGGPMIGIEIEGGKEAAFRFANALRVIKISNNLGDAKSLITHPATTTHQRLTPEARGQLGIGDGLLRVSVGLEDPDDLERDLRRGLMALKGAS